MFSDHFIQIGHRYKQLTAWMTSIRNLLFLTFLSWRSRPWERRKRFWGRSCLTWRKPGSSYSVNSPAETEPSSSSEWWDHLSLLHLPNLCPGRAAPASRHVPASSPVDFSSILVLLIFISLSPPLPSFRNNHLTPSLSRHSSSTRRLVKVNNVCALGSALLQLMIIVNIDHLVFKKVKKRVNKPFSYI